jgi:hypothetical protein
VEIENRWRAASVSDDFHKLFEKAVAKNAPAFSQFQPGPEVVTWVTF